MSGPKGYSLRLAAEVRRARDEAAARVRCGASLARRADAVRRLVALGGEAAPGRDPDLTSASLERLELMEQELADEVQVLLDAERSTKAALVRRQLAATFDQLGEITDVVPTMAAAPSRAAPRTVDAGEVRESLVRCLDRIAHLDDGAQEELTGAVAAVRSLLDAGQAVHADVALMSVQTRCEAAARAQRERERVARQAGLLVVRAADLEGPLGQDIRDRAERCTAKEELAAVEELERQVRAQLTAEQDRRFIVRQTEEALRELGYEVGEGMVDLAGSGAAVVRRPDLPDHAVEISFAAQAPRVLTRVVALGETTRQRDVEAEEITCQDLLALGRLWAERGVQAELYSHAEPGEVALKRVSDGRARPSRRATRERRLP
ncbi:hypothetical protein [Ornithinimicrobium avium]|uniref:Uncharacterized protein n=1 Tax=Ornithinimicrobium avium TaxID=2283195 RepID=A0A345NK93_9MICO|nr:hypothetical protein [Ornithinimicrobium avium]AXH95451.1 hypothetical protein DV701_04295 [Ornithinimicrobium avium]